MTKAGVASAAMINTVAFFTFEIAGCKGAFSAFFDANAILLWRKQVSPFGIRALYLSQLWFARR